MTDRIVKRVPVGQAGPGYRELAVRDCAQNWMALNPIFIDTEATGLNTREDEIIEIGIVSLGGTVLLDTLVKPTKPIPAEATAIHGITDAMVADAPTFREVALKVRSIAATSRLVCAWNAEFDFTILLTELGRCHLFTSWPAWRCVQQLYSYWYGDWSRLYDAYNLQRLQYAIERHDLQRGTAHRAASDAEMTRQLLLWLSAATCDVAPPIEPTEKLPVVQLEGAV